MSRFNNFLNLQMPMDSAQVRQVLGTLSVNLKSIDGKQKITEVNAAMAECRKMLRQGGSVEDSTRLYGLLAAAIAAVENFIRDNQWRVTQ